MPCDLSRFGEDVLMRCQPNLADANIQLQIQIRGIFLKNQLIVLALLSAVTVLSNAGTLNLDLRSDYQSENYNQGAKTATGVSDNNKFYIQTGRLDYQGKYSEQISYRARIRFAGKDQGAMSKRDSTNATLDLAYVTDQFSENTSLTVGKFGSDVGGFEGTTNGADLYLASEAYTGTTYLGGVNTGYSDHLYYTGAKVTQLMGDHEFALHAANLPSDNMSGGKLAQNTNFIGGVYKGTLYEKNLGFMLSHHSARSTVTGVVTMDTKTELSAAGVQYKLEDFVIQFSYGLNSYRTTSDNVNTVGSAAAIVRYSTQSWLPFVKVVSSTEAIKTLASEVRNKYLSYAIGTEYRHQAEDKFRYHALMQNRTMSPDSAVSPDSRNLTQVIVGIRIMADILK